MTFLITLICLKIWLVKGCAGPSSTFYLIRLYSLSAMIKVGDNHWYGKTVPRNITRAAEMYGKAVAKNDHPHVSTDEWFTLVMIKMMITIVICKS